VERVTDCVWSSAKETYEFQKEEKEEWWWNEEGKEKVR